MQPTRRNLSYRKPVPVFVPSPPPSPVATVGQVSASSHKAMYGELPPLPDDWREAISHALTGKADSLTGMARSQSCIDFPSTDSPVYPPPSATSRSTKSSRKPHHNYRPPTPPLHPRCLDDDDGSPAVRRSQTARGSLDCAEMSSRFEPGVNTIFDDSIAGSSVLTLTADRSLAARKVRSSNVCTDLGLSTWVGSASTCSSPPIEDTVDGSSWFAFPSHKPCMSHRESAGRTCDGRTRPEFSTTVWRRLGTWGRVFRTRLHSLPVCTVVY